LSDGRKRRSKKQTHTNYETNEERKGQGAKTLPTIGADFGNRSTDYDYYATPPVAVHKLLDREVFNSPIWEPCSGENHIVNVLKLRGYQKVRASDIVKRTPDTELLDFTLAPMLAEKWQGDIITNPPYNIAEQIIRTALDIIPDGNRAAFLLPVRYLEGQARAKLFDEFPPQKLYVFSKRITCAINGDFANTGNGALSYAWFIWCKGFKETPTLHWL